MCSSAQECKGGTGRLVGKSRISLVGTANADLGKPPDDCDGVECGMRVSGYQIPPTAAPNSTDSSFDEVSHRQDH